VRRYRRFPGVSREGCIAAGAALLRPGPVSYAGYLAALLDQQRITRAHIVAHDFGGAWALTWAVRHPEAFFPAQVELLEGHGHWVMHEDPERIAALVIPFLRSQLPSAGN
jgi:pimeloyl-ACP methyl ester carboxylesterase